MNKENSSQRKTDREYIQNKSILYIGDCNDTEEIIGVFIKSFKSFKSSVDISDIVKTALEVDIIFCNENKNSIEYLKKVREVSNDIPFVLYTSVSQLNTQGFVEYIEYGLAQHITREFSNTEIVYILQNELRNYETLLKNKQLVRETQAYISVLDKSVIVSKTDLKGKITYANDIFCDISGYTKEELIGSNHNILRHPEMPKTAFKQMWETIQNDSVWSGEIRNLAKDGEEYIAKSTISPIFENGRKIGYIGIRYLVTNDINERKILKTHIRKSTIEKNQEIQKLNKTVEILNKELRQYTIFGGSAESFSLGLEIKKNQELQIQIRKLEKDLKEATDYHSQKIASYLKERREGCEKAQKQAREIETLKEEILQTQEKLGSFKEAINEKEHQVKEYLHRIKELDDLLEHREEQLKKAGLL